MYEWEGRDVSGEKSIHVKAGRGTVWIEIWDNHKKITRVLPLMTAREMGFALLYARDEAINPTSDDDPPCSGTGYAHKPHGRCPGYTYDRT